MGLTLPDAGGDRSTKESQARRTLVIPGGHVKTHSGAVLSRTVQAL